MLKILLAILVTATIAVLACFALGAFDGDGVVRVDGKDFSEFTFSGDLRDGVFCGPGLIYFNEGERFSGNFSDGRFDGMGAFYSAQNEWNFSGVFQSGEISGGTLHKSRDGLVTIERGDDADTLTGAVWQLDGNFNDHGQTGDGTFVFADGSVYTGGFLNGLADGEGTYRGSSGRVIYQGGLREGLFDGQGTYWSLEGWTYEGGFSGGLFHGEGVVTIGGKTVRGVWEAGVQVARYE